MKNIPENWILQTTKKGLGTKYVNPANVGDYLRFSNANIDPRAPLGQKVPYFQRWKDGKCLTKSGTWVYLDELDNRKDIHIPQKHVCNVVTFVTFVRTITINAL